MKDKKYWQDVRRKAKELGSDGCSGVIDFYVDCCSEHDIAYETDADVYGHPMTRAEADADFRRCIQSKSPFGAFSPMSYWRWLGVRLFGKDHYASLR